MNDANERKRVSLARGAGHGAPAPASAPEALRRGLAGTISGGGSEPVGESEGRSPSDKDDLERRVAAHRWYHSIDLGGGIVTRGIDDTPVRLARLDLPASLEGLSVLDIGAWDGFFSFECERRGASRVVATDYYSWHGSGWGAKAGFELAREALRSRVEDVDIDVMDISPERLGTFDLVLFLGVLYHLRHPLLAIDKIAAVTRSTLIIETVVDLVGLTRPAMAFYPDRELNQDPTNWWGPNHAAVVGMLKSAGFDDVTVVSRTPGPLYRGARAVWHRLRGKNQLLPAFHQDRAVFHARKRQQSRDRMI